MEAIMVEKEMRPWADQLAKSSKAKKDWCDFIFISHSTQRFMLKIEYNRF